MMSCLRMVEAKLPPGFRFHPRDDELICDYLMPKAAAANPNGAADQHYLHFPMLLLDLDLNKIEPWDLPEVACVGGGKEWYFFNLRDRKYATGQRTNRATLSGYWKATGKDRQVARKCAFVGMRKTLVFYQGRAPKGKKTDWVMHEFRMEGDPPPKISCKEDWVLCRVFYKSRGIGMCSKPATSESCYDDTCSSSLPTLTDTYVTFDQTIPPSRPINFEGPTFTGATNATFEQVPCFSNFTQQFIPTSNFLNQVLPCDNKVIRSVLDQLSKLEGKEEVQPSLAQARCESYMTETALSSSMWYPF